MSYDMAFNFWSVVGNIIVVPKGEANQGRQQSRMREKVSKKSKELAQELKNWQDGKVSFTCALFELLNQANDIERQKLFTVFSEEVGIWEEWREDPKEFFLRYDLN